MISEIRKLITVVFYFSHRLALSIIHESTLKGIFKVKIFLNWVCIHIVKLHKDLLPHSYFSRIASAQLKYFALLLQVQMYQSRLVDCIASTAPGIASPHKK